MSNNLFDPKMYKHVKSDDKTTTLQHKRGHTITVAHNAIDSKMRGALQALAKIGPEAATNTQAQESQDQKQYGKVIMKAEGGDVEQKTFLGQPVYGTGVSKPKAPDHEGTPPGSDEPWPLPSQTSVGKAIQAKKDAQAQPEANGGEVRMAKGGNVETPAAPGSTPNGAYDAGLPCLNPNCKSHGRPHPNCRCYAGMADGGEVSKLRYCAHGKPHEKGCEYSSDHLNSGKGGTSTQGDMVRHREDAKPEAQGRINMERTIRPKLADGGDVPYGMSPSDMPKDQPQEQPQRQEQQPIPTPEQPSMMLKPGMPGADEKHEDNDDDGGKTDQAMYDKIHGGDQYGRMPAEQPQTAQQPEAQSDVNPIQAATPQASAPLEQPQQPPDHASDIINENKAFQQDLMNGHIAPKTYNDLMFHNKDGSEKSTLGKIGSIFGVILAGMGAGLTHQPNAALQMMDNAIKNDLDAQMKSKENAQNFFRINQARMLNEANIKSTLASADKTDAEKAATLQGVQIKAAAQTYADMGSVAVKQIHDMIQRMPEGPEKQKASQLGLMVAQAAETNGAKAAMMAAAGMNNLSMYGVNPTQSGGNQDPEQKFQNDMQARENSGDKAGADSLRERHIPGVQGFASGPVPPATKDKVLAMQILNNKVKDVMSYAKQHLGSIDPNVRATARQKAEELTAFYNQSVDNLGMTAGRMQWLEKQIKTNPTDFIPQLMGNNARLEEIRSSNSNRMDSILSGKGGLGFPKQGSGTTAPQQEKTSKSGKPIVFRNGRWEYK